MTKEVLDEIIKRRHREGKTLSIRRINNEELRILKFTNDLKSITEVGRML